MRQLATIRKIKEIRPIEGADSIELAIVDGWQSVVKKGEFFVDESVIYLEVDSFVPTELAPFLSKGKEPREYNGVKGERLRTMKLRGALSQGLILPFTAEFAICKLGAGPGAEFDDYIGKDVTEILGIQKWEKPIPVQLQGVVRGNWPEGIPKTDEERIQNIVNEWSEYTPCIWEVTEKLEGTSFTCGMVNGEFIVCSRNLNLKETEDNLYWKIARQYQIEEKFKVHQIDNLVIQGEIIGEKVEGNHYEIQGQEMFVFNVFDVANGSYFFPMNRMNFTLDLELDHVPQLHGLSNIRDYTPEQILQMANGYSSINPKKLREGIVFKQSDGNKHFKAVSNEYLLKHGG